MKNLPYIQKVSYVVKHQNSSVSTQTTRLKIKSWYQHYSYSALMYLLMQCYLLWNMKLILVCAESYLVFLDRKICQIWQKIIVI